MAIIQCHECGKDVSTSAKSCPSCGAKPKKPRSALSKVIWWTFGIMILFPVIMALFVDPPPASPPSPYEIEQAQAEAEAQTLRIRARSGADAIRENMRNPDSFKISGMAYNSKTKAICYEYRAQNGFGGMNVGQSVLGANEKWIAIDASPNLKSAWKKHCSSDLVEVNY